MDASLLLQAKEKDQQAIRSGNTAQIKEVFKENAALLKKFLQENAWPTKENISTEVSSAAWLIAQHADHDPMFQLQCLALIIAHINTKDKEIMQDIAFLLDRILVNTQQIQVFGTQLNGKSTIPETISPQFIDSLRNKFGLEPIKGYIERVKTYAEKQED